MGRLNKEDRKNITQYYQLYEIPVLFADSIWDIKHIYLAYRKKILVLSSYRLVRGVLSRLGFRVANSTQELEKCQRFLAFRDALLLLCQKGIPVYFYNRIGKEKNNYPYSESACQRMAKGLSFPKMYEEIDKYESDFKELFGSLYSKAYIEQIGKIPQVIKKGDVYCHEDMQSKYVNVINGQRITCYQPKDAGRVIHFYGRCGAFGYAVEDKDSLPSQLQKSLLDHHVTDIRVVNHGLWGGEDSYIDHNFINDSVGMKEGDVVVFYRMHLDKRVMNHLEAYGLRYKEITHEWHQHPEAKWCFYDKPGHMNSVGYRIVASILCDDLILHKFSALPVNPESLTNFRSNHLTTYLKKHRNPEFYKEIDHYVQGILASFPLAHNIRKCGSIVMNCNPFTKGHRYLIEHAASQVDRLYVFVGEENKSFFEFADRLEMVKRGTADIDNVVVTTSGHFMISSYTFPEYFMKDYVKEKNFDVTNDLEIFCKHIAPPLKIKVRFAGEEPFDPVTSNYNENMRSILPKYGMEFFEIPRLALDKGTVINATEVRRLLKEKQFDSIREYVPKSTLEILMEKYA